jgi:FAD synthase
VRNLSPEAFVQLMAEELQVAGVVVGSNYRFGYRAAGTAQLLQQLGPQHGMQVRVLSLVGLPAAAAEAGEAAAAAAEAGASRDEEHASRDGPQAAEVQPAEAVSSSRVRHALAAGDMEDAAECLGRRYRLVASLEAAPTPASGCEGPVLHLPATAVLNQPPGAGRYAVMASLAGSDTLQEVAPPREAVVTVDEAGLSLQGGGSSDFHLLRQPGARLLVLDFLSEA